MSKPEIRVVLISAEPEGHSATEPTRELEDIRAAVSAGQVKVVRESIYHATRESVMSGIKEHQPQLVHWHSHGTRDGVFIEGRDGTSTRVEAKWLIEVIGTCRQTRLVVLSACESILLAEALARSPKTTVQAAIAWTVPIPNTHVRAFSAALYRQLASGIGVRAAFDFARLTLETSVQDKVELVERVKEAEFLLYDLPPAPLPPSPPPPPQPTPPTPPTRRSPVLRLRVLVVLLLTGFIALTISTQYDAWSHQQVPRQKTEEEKAADEAAAKKAADEKAAEEEAAAEKATKTNSVPDPGKKVVKTKPPVTDPAAGKTEPAEKTEPAAEKTEPAAEKTEPAAEQTEPAAEQTEPTKKSEGSDVPKTVHAEIIGEPEIRPLMRTCPIAQKCPTMAMVRATLAAKLKSAVQGCPGKPPAERIAISMEWTEPDRPRVTVTSVKAPAKQTMFVACVRTTLERVETHATVVSAKLEFSVKPM